MAIEVECKAEGCPNEGIVLTYTIPGNEEVSLRCCCNGLLYTNSSNVNPTMDTPAQPKLEPSE